MMKLEDLQHVKKEINGGGHVIVLNTGGVIDSEAEAMLQALHSRSLGGLEGHLQVLGKRGAEKFMENFYVGYGHKSIGDCGTTTIFVEGVSMLVAKAIQDTPLYSGQEASTRYIDFAEIPFMNPAGSDEGVEILETWRRFYLESMPKVVESLKERYPKGEDEKEGTYDKAINARAFDILRGFLPAGATTNLAWHTNLRQAADHLEKLRHHPLEEVQNVAAAIQAALQEAHPSSFGHKHYETTETYNAATMRDDYYFHDAQCPDFALTRNDIDTSLLPRIVLESRPEKTELPKYLAEAGTMQFAFTLDFGSYRDIQRHRAVTQRMPLLTTDIGFHPWYLGELPEDVRTDAQDLLDSQVAKIKKLGLDREAAQYYVAMGFLTSNRVTGSLPALVYLTELRATRFVHPTLRIRAVEMSRVLEQELHDAGLVMHLDDEPDRFDVKRGEHDIVLKA